MLAPPSPSDDAALWTDLDMLGLADLWDSPAAPGSPWLPGKDFHGGGGAPSLWGPQELPMAGGGAGEPAEPSTSGSSSLSGADAPHLAEARPLQYGTDIDALASVSPAPWSAPFFGAQLKPRLSPPVGNISTFRAASDAAFAQSAAIGRQPSMGRYSDVVLDGFPASLDCTAHPHKHAPPGGLPSGPLRPVAIPAADATTGPHLAGAHAQSSSSFVGLGEGGPAPPGFFSLFSSPAGAAGGEISAGTPPAVSAARKGAQKRARTEHNVFAPAPGVAQSHSATGRRPGARTRSDMSGARLSLNPKSLMAGLAKHILPRLQTVGDGLILLQITAGPRLAPLVDKYGDDFLQPETAQMLGKCARQAQPLIAAILDKIRVEVAAKVMRAELFGPALPRDAEIVAALGGESYELEGFARFLWRAFADMNDSVVGLKRARDDAAAAAVTAGSAGPVGAAAGLPSPVQMQWEANALEIILGHKDLIAYVVAVVALAREAEFSSEMYIAYLRVSLAVVDFFCTYCARMTAALVVREGWVLDRIRIREELGHERLLASLGSVRAGPQQQRQLHAVGGPGAQVVVGFSSAAAGGVVAALPLASAANSGSLAAHSQMVGWLGTTAAGGVVSACGPLSGQYFLPSGGYIAPAGLAQSRPGVAAAVPLLPHHQQHVLLTAPGIPTTTAALGGGMLHSFNSSGAQQQGAYVFPTAVLPAAGSASSAAVAWPGGGGGLAPLAYSQTSPLLYHQPLAAADVLNQSLQIYCSAASAAAATYLLTSSPGGTSPPSGGTGASSLLTGGLGASVAVGGVVGAASMASAAAAAAAASAVLGGGQRRRW